MADVQREAARHLERVDWPVVGERVRLRPTTAADVDRLFDLRADEATHRWLARRVTDRAEWRRLYREPHRLASSLVVELHDLVIGDLMVVVQDGWAQADVADAAKAQEAELGWVIDPAFAGQGYATEAIRALIRVCFVDLGLRRVVAHCFADNVASWRLMERVGMRREAHTVRDSLHRELGWLDGYSYALLAEEWDSGSKRAP